MGTPAIEHPMDLPHIPLRYSCFDSPITDQDCGEKCAPYNEKAVPFCCDTRHAVPTAYLPEWEYLRISTNLWRVYQPDNIADAEGLKAQTPPNQVLIECQGHRFCQRNYRSITCRAFPFFPYIDPHRRFIGLTYYWQFEDRCWVINHLENVTLIFLREFIQTYEKILQAWHEEIEQFLYQSKIMRQVFGRRKQQIPIFVLSGELKAVSTRTGLISDLNPRDIPKSSVYKIANNLRFPDEHD